MSSHTTWACCRLNRGVCIGDNGPCTASLWGIKVAVGAHNMRSIATCEILGKLECNDNNNHDNVMCVSVWFVFFWWFTLMLIHVILGGDVTIKSGIKNENIVPLGFGDVSEGVTCKEYNVPSPPDFN